MAKCVRNSVIFCLHCLRYNEIHVKGKLWTASLDCRCRWKAWVSDCCNGNLPSLTWLPWQHHVLCVIPHHRSQQQQQKQSRRNAVAWCCAWIHGGCIGHISDRPSDWHPIIVSLTEYNRITTTTRVRSGLQFCHYCTVFGCCFQKHYDTMHKPTTCHSSTLDLLSTIK